MILHGQKKRVLKEIVRYYCSTTENQYQDFISEIQSTRGIITPEMSYSEWLAVHSYNLLKKYEITLEDCIENKDIINSAINEESSRQQGEFYTPEVWCKDGRQYLKDMLGDRWGEVYIWDASCGTGNLMRTEGYPQDKLFLSTFLEEDVELVKKDFPDATVFQLDFLNGIDWDSNNKRFSEKLPKELLYVLENDLPLVFYMNPPYKVGQSDNTDLGAYMGSIGMAKCALDMFHQFMYRMVTIKRFYNMSDVSMGIFGPVTMFHSEMLGPLFTDFKKDFIFHDGMMFDAGDFSNTSESVGWVIGYTAWRTKKEGEVDRPIMLDAKAKDSNDNIILIGKRPIKSIDINLHDWMKEDGVFRYDRQLPIVTNYNNFKDTTMKAPANYLGYIMSSNYVIRGTRRACVTTLPNPDNIVVTEFNFWRAVASFSARRSYARNISSFNNSQYYSKPDETIEGYEQWLNDALVLFLFDYSAHQSAYRDVEVDGAVWNINNRLFPIDVEVIKTVVTDEVILNDIEKHGAENSFILSVLQERQAHFSPTAKELYEVGLSMILESLVGDKRKEIGYANWTKAWDAGLVQIREAGGLVSDEKQERYAYLLTKLKHELLDGVYKYGFMMDTLFATDEPDSFEELTDESDDELEDAPLGEEFVMGV